MRSWVVPGYAEDRVLGNGASGRVVAAVHEASGQPVAIKYLAARLLRDPGFLAGFRAEAEPLRSLDVPEVVRIYDYVEAPRRGAAIVMELVNGVSLYQMIKHQGPAGPETALTVLKGSLLGLASAHALGIVHRDYKPENVLVDDEGISKLVDFGVAVKAGRHAPAAGTPLYMAPEQWAGAPPTAESDIYAATAVFFECLTGKPPFSGGMAQLALQHETAAVPVDQVDEPLRGLIARGMAKDPWDRPVNASEFLRELEYRAAASYGPFWEERGRSRLRERAAALLSLSGAGAGGGGQALAATVPGDAGRRRKIILAAAALGAIAVFAITGTVFALQGTGSGSPAPGPAGSTSSVGPATSPVSGQPPATTGTPSSQPGTPSPATGTPPARVVPPAGKTPPTSVPATGTRVRTSPAPPAHPSTRPPTTARTTAGVPPPKSTAASPPPTSAPATTPPPTSAPGGTPSSAPASSPPATP